MKFSESNPLSSLWDKIKEKNYSNDYCFLCSDLIREDNRSEEHIFPKWLQHKFNLWDQKITLLNQTQINYRNLTIPCCNACNSEHLSLMENKVKNAVNRGFEAFKDLDKLTLFQWAGKIFYGLMYKELFLKLEMSNPDSKTILSDEVLKDFETHFIFLQSIRNKIIFKDFFPASIFICQTQVTEDSLYHWDFIDNPQNLFIAIRMGEIGLILMLQDGGSQESKKDELRNFFEFPLHPIQFRELATQINYKGLLFNRKPKYLFLDTDQIEVIQLPLGGLSGKPIFDDWDHDYYGKLLMFYLNMPKEVVNPKPGMVRTWIKKDDGSLNFMDVKEF